MSTAKHLIDRAASYIGVKQEGSGLSSSEYTDGLDTLNDLIVELQERNVHFAIAKIDSIDSEVGEPDWASSYLKTQLALRLAPEFSAAITQDFAMFARKAERRLLARVIDLKDVNLADIVPVGSGNQDTPDYQNQFYRDRSAQNLNTASGVSIEDEEADNITVNSDSIIGSNR